MTDLKPCSCCRRRLPFTAFAGRSASSDGLQNYCRECAAAWAKEHRSRALAAAPAVGPGEKWCRRCEQVKALEGFGSHAKTWDKKQTYCRECFAAIYREKRESLGHVVRPADVPAGHKFCRGCRTVLPLSAWSARSTTKDGYAFRCRACMAGADRAKHLIRTYGLTVSEVDRLLESQGGTCAICCTSPAVHVDHDHSTGKVRGILCFRCNAALGQFGDDPRVLRRAARYLDRSRDLRPREHVVVEMRDWSFGTVGASRLESAFLERLLHPSAGTAS